MATITGNTANNWLVGTALNDLVFGLDGNETLGGGSGYDTLEGGDGDDILFGGLGNDLLLAGAGNDVLHGDHGDDTLVGGLGRDIMFGGAGADVFYFDDRDAGDVSAGPLSDVIRDFSPDDVLDIVAVDVLYFWGWGVEPERGGFGIWQTNGNTYVTWNTFDGFHDIELTGYTGDPYSQIRWYEDDYTANVNTTGQIAAGQTRTGTIEVSQDQDWFQITLTQGELYTIDLQGRDSGAGTLGDPYLVLLDANGNYVAEDDNGSGTLDARLLFLAETSGTYYISASDYYYGGGGTGTYLLGVTARTYVDDYAGDTSTTGEIAAGETRSGEIGVPNDQDWFQITFTQGELYTFDLQGQDSGSGTLQDPYLELFDVDGIYVIGENVDTGTRDSRLLFLAENSGTYYISAGGYPAGTYQLGVTAETYVDDYAGDASTTGEIAAGETLTGEIGVPYDQDWFRITLTEGDTYTIDLRGQASGSGTLPDPYLILLDADGSYVADNDDWNSLDSKIIYTASATGTYFIDARELGNRIGTYELSVSAGEVLAAGAEAGNSPLMF